MRRFPTKKLCPLACAVLLLVVSWTPSSQAVLCALDEVPAATLVVPYFEVDLDGCGTRDTVVTIVNTVAETTVAHITLWTDWGVPSLDFDVYLTGYDRLEFSLARAFCDGSIPVTGPNEVNHGAFSEGPATPAGCENFWPFPDPAIVGNLRDRVLTFHTGQENPQSESCHGADYGDNVARGWITIDVVEECSLLFPTDPEYYLEAIGYDNHLLGEVLFTDSTTGESALMPAIHLEAAPQGTLTRTFYGSLGGTTLDRREPLPTRYALRTTLGEDSDLIFWREPFSTHDPIVGVPCGTNPPGFPVPENPFFAFDEEENPVLFGASASLMTQKSPVTTSDPGWLQFDGRHDGALPFFGNDLAQAWVGKVVRLGASGQRLTGAGYPVDQICQ